MSRHRQVSRGASRRESAAKRTETPAPAQVRTTGRLTDPRGFRVRALLLVALGLLIYANSLFNEYALDDGIVIEHNAYVQQGWAGIPKILTTDAYDSYTRQMGAGQQLSGGRYRPLSIVTFAVEHQLFGRDPFVSHAVNVALYLLTIGLLLLLLETLDLPGSPWTAFAGVLLFTIHPLHTEVVANIKSRDEILSLLFFLAVLLLALRGDAARSARATAGMLSAFGLALLSKEYAVVLLALVPILLFVFRDRSAPAALRGAAPLVPVAAVYAAIRVACVGASQVAAKDVLNDPYLFATSAERWATKLLVLGTYLRLLVMPWPLSADYSFKTIPYVTFADPRVWLSAAVYAALIAAAWTFCRRRRAMGFALAFFLLPLALVGNLVVSIGATLGERLIYHSSVGFCLAAALAGNRGLARLRAGRTARTALAAGALTALTLVCAAIVVPRNALWKNDATLFVHDVKVVPESVLANGKAGAGEIELADRPENAARSQELLRAARAHLEKAVALHPAFANGYLSLGVAAFKLGDMEAARKAWAEAARIYPGHPLLAEYTAKLAEQDLAAGLAAARAGRLDDAIARLEAARTAAPSSAEIWAQLGGAYYTRGDAARARDAWTRALALDPSRADARAGLRAMGRR